MKTRLIKTALVAAVAGITLIGFAGTAQAEDPITTQDAEGTVSSKDGISVYNDATDGATSAHPLVLTAGGQEQYVYCIDLHTSLQFKHTYVEEDWETSGVANLGKIKWILHNAFPNVSAADLLANAKATLPDTYSEDEVDSFVYAATQAAIWHRSDGFNLRAEDSTKADDDVDAAVLAIYTYLTDADAELPDPGKPELAFSGSTTGKTSDKIKVDVDSNLGTITLKVDGGKAVDKDGKEITEIKGGQSFWLTSDKAGTVTVTGTGEINVPAGRIFLSKESLADPEKKSQKLILAGALVKPGEGKHAVKFTEAPALAVTGTSVTIMSIAGVALLGGGVALAMMFMRRRRAAAAVWGGDEDGLA
ncbi:thioester domain-containing protein [Phytomonospora endophytica]|uniref:TQXA domain-containing protein n=1 Tax=Phytomonospora endophytica TaxID=714109 RepID=A0A841FST6_9ACTN|nr:thioester domain-containing protein [Phytomonospora endophytica]MBB6036602.1 TQXA domain-containing protein [Phytomonospora endophytica]GIG65923.1 hypothetical protein Pen01_22180 [Phytomonospora endophytica]